MFPKVVQVIPMKDYTVYVYFEDGKIVCYDMNDMIEKEVFNPLKDIQVFMETCTVMNDTLAWDTCKNWDNTACFEHSRLFCGVSTISMARGQIAA